MTPAELKTILELHGKWARGEDGCKRANLGRADLSKANLDGADLSRANLSGADLSGALLSGANLYGALLRRAFLTGARLSGTCILDIGQRSDGWQFCMQLRDNDEPIVLAGCRYLPLSEARKHWDKTRPPGTPLGDETRLILDHGERLAALRCTR